MIHVKQQPRLSFSCLIIDSCFCCTSQLLVGGSFIGMGGGDILIRFTSSTSQNWFTNIFFPHLTQASPSCRNVFSSISSDMITEPAIALVLLLLEGNVKGAGMNLARPVLKDGRCSGKLWIPQYSCSVWESILKPKNQNQIKWWDTERFTSLTSV